MATTTTSPALRMKLLVDTKAQRVLFAEAGKDVVDFLFSLLSLPVATAVALVGKESAAGSVGNLYASVEGLEPTYLLPGAAKDALLYPAVVSPAATATSSLLLMPAPPSAGERPKVFFQCGTNNYCYGGGGYGRSSSCYLYVTDASGTRCPSCGEPMTRALPFQYVAPAGCGGGGGSGKKVMQSAFAGGSTRGFVQGAVTYTVMDDLTVTPMSAISSITLLNGFAVADLAALQEMTVQIGYSEGLEILKASLQSKTVLTDVFLGKMAPCHA